MFEPSRATGTPPNTPTWPPYNRPRVAAVRSPSNGRNVLRVAAPATPLSCFVPWYERKKNAFFPTSGPPRLPPYWFCDNLAVGRPARFLENSLAFGAQPGKNSWADPRNLAPPALVAMLTTAPPCLPYSAS